jgi:tetratricopeptide (TPR) repeat protein
LADEIVAESGNDRRSDVARQLIEVGAENEALALLEAPVTSGGREMNEGNALIANSLLAAQTRLEIGRYHDAQESLRLVELQGPKGGQAVAADLLRLKLALRQNAYSIVWTIADKLQGAGPSEFDAELERELVLNAALRDLNDRGAIERSVGVLNELLKGASRSGRGKIERSLARSYAKLGKNSEAVAAARNSLAIAEADEDLRSIGNARLALAEALRYGGSTSEAIESYRLGAEIGRGTGNRDSEIWCLLGMACAYVEGGDPESAALTSETLQRILFEPGFEHPLEAAHLDLIRAVLSILAGEPCDVTRVLAAYEALGVGWPKEYLASVSQHKALPSPIPL